MHSAKLKNSKPRVYETMGYWAALLKICFEPEIGFPLKNVDLIT